MEILVSLLLFLIFGMFLIWLFSDKHLDKAQEKMIREIMQERRDNK